MDIKGYSSIHCGSRGHSRTIVAGHYRYPPGLFACDNQAGATMKASLASVFSRYRLPECILRDNDPPRGNVGAGHGINPAVLAPPRPTVDFFYWQNAQLDAL